MTTKTWVIIIGIAVYILAVLVLDVEVADVTDELRFVLQALPVMAIVIVLLAVITSWATRSTRLLAKEMAEASPEQLRRAIKQGARPNARNRLGQTPLMLASWFNSREAVSVLLAAGAEVNAKCRQGKTALMYAAQAGKPEVVEVLLQAGADVQTVDDEGATALMYAAQSGKNAELIKLLLQAGVDPNAKTNTGWSALTVAVLRSEDPEIIRELQQAGANIHERSQGLTTLMLAAANANVEVLKVLLAAGCYVNALGPSGTTPLMWAARLAKHPEAVEALLQAGADGAQRDETGRTAFDYAKENKFLAGTAAYEALRQAAGESS
ncbi:MAG TPA: hypothetical protein GXX29_12820 [Firmicutes bacterium]|nr:hypothetical protein [Bacillota bacterium]